MHFIVFEGTTEEHERHGESQETRGSWKLCGTGDLKAIAPGDTLWIATRIHADRPMPALCGRLLSVGVERHRPGTPEFDPAHSDCDYRLIADEDKSERCVPFACSTLRSWAIWRQPFRGVRMLNTEQADALTTEWDKAERQAR